MAQGPHFGRTGPTLMNWKANECTVKTEADTQAAARWSARARSATKAITHNGRHANPVSLAAQGDWTWVVWARAQTSAKSRRGTEEGPTVMKAAARYLSTSRVCLDRIGLGWKGGFAGF